MRRGRGAGLWRLREPARRKDSQQRKVLDAHLHAQLVPSRLVQLIHASPIRVQSQSTRMRGSCAAHARLTRGSRAARPHLGNPFKRSVGDVATHVDVEVDQLVQQLDLLRDDLGFINDLTSTNHEMAYSRGVPEGEYIVNVHMFRNDAQIWPTPVYVMVSIKTDISKPPKKILFSKVELVRLDQETTVFRFDLNEEGGLIPHTVNDLFKSLFDTQRL